MVNQEQPSPTHLKLLQKSRILEITFSDGKHFALPCEYLRVFSPSAEVQGHAGQGRKLVVGKQDVNIVSIEPVGQYAVKLIFDDGHKTGLYSWPVLHDLGVNYAKNWQQYLGNISEITPETSP